MAININNMRELDAIDILKLYDGTNPYIIKLKNKYFKKIQLTRQQVTYVLENHDKHPEKLDRLVKITDFLGEELKTQFNLKFIPTKIYVGFLLAQTEKAFHIYGKVSQKQSLTMFFVPKTQLLDDITHKKIEIDVNIEKLKEFDQWGRTPYDHQLSGIKFLAGRDGAILADDMGLGKTYVSIVSAFKRNFKKILIVCPASVKLNWEKEINAFTDDVTVISGNRWKEARFTIINFDILKNFQTITDGRKKYNPDEIKTILSDGNFDVVIIDEAHKIKTHTSKRSKILSEVVLKNKQIKTVWLLTGTPMANRPMDYFNLLNIIRSPIATNWKFFALRYCEGRQITNYSSGTPRKVWLTTGASNLDELREKTQSIVLRRLKHEVLDMPDKTVSTHYHKLSRSERKEYEELWETYLEERRADGKSVNIQRDLTELILLRQHVAMSMIPNTIELAEDAIEQGHKVIIFTTFTDELMELQEHFKKSAVIHYGGLSVNQKERSVELFQNNKNKKVFIGNVISAGVGITLTAGDIVIFNSFDWVPGNNVQAEDRAYRIGQDNNVSVYYQIFEDTVSVRMLKTVNDKNTIIDQVIQSTKEEKK